MLTKTTETAIQVLVLLALRNQSVPVSPARLAAHLDASVSYMAKITHLLVKAGLLQATRGARGGVSLAASPSRIGLLSVVEACQGKVLGDYCTGEIALEQTCAYHEAMYELHEAIVGTLERWTIADLAARPTAASSVRGNVNCRMARAHTASSQTQ